MSIDWFNENVRPLLIGCKFERSSFPAGDFGALERVEVEGGDKLATVDIWSEGWVGFDIYDCVLDDQIMNVLVSPDEKGSIHEILGRFVKLMTENNARESM